MNNPMAQVHRHVSFRNKIAIPTVYGSEALSFRKHFSGSALRTSVVERGFWFESFFYGAKHRARQVRRLRSFKASESLPSVRGHASRIIFPRLPPTAVDDTAIRDASRRPLRCTSAATRAPKQQCAREWSLPTIIDLVNGHCRPQ